MFWRSKFKVKHSPSLSFVKGLITSEKSPNIVYNKYCYRYYCELIYTDIKIKLSYDRLRKQWDIEVWNMRPVIKSIFSYYGFDPRPMDTIQYLLKEYDVDKKFDEMIDVDVKQDKKDENFVDEIRLKYMKLGGECNAVSS